MALARVAGAISREALQDRQRERRGLAGAGLGEAEEVTSGENMRDRLRLDRRGLLVALGGDRLCDRRDQAQLGKLHRGDIASPANNRYQRGLRLTGL